MSKTIATKKTTRTAAAKSVKTARKATPAKKAVARKTKKVVRTPKPLPKVAPIKEKMTKAQLADHLAYEAGTERKTVLTILSALNAVAAGSLKKNGVGEFTIPGLVKLVTKKIPAKRVPAIKKGTLVRNPRTGEEREHEGRAAYTKPATVKVRARSMSLMKKYAVGASA